MIIEIGPILAATVLGLPFAYYGARLLARLINRKLNLLTGNNQP